METQVLIIGGGVTGAGVVRDLALRGVGCVLAERRDAAAGASGANHGLLHSGGRYVFSDPATARECRRENHLLKRLAPSCIEPCGGLFVAVAGDDEGYIARFPELCAAAGLSCQPLGPAEARDREPGLSPTVIAAFAVEDGSVNPFKLTLDNLDQAQALGARVLYHAGAVAMERAGRRIRSVKLTLADGGEVEVQAEQVVNAAGAWTGRIAALAGVALPILYSKGSLIITQQRVARGVVNRLRPPGDGDIIVPGGTVSVIGTTSERVADPDRLHVTMAEVDLLVEEAARLIPALAGARYLRSYAGVRPLFGGGGGPEAASDRQVSRGFAVLDHEAQGLDNLATITGGKLTTYRLMAEKAADLICHRLGVSAPCRTAELPLPAPAATAWMEPQELRKKWFKEHAPEDHVLCECEMVPLSVLDMIVADLLAQGLPLDLRDVSLRSRVGRGACQGAFCSHRIVAHWYEQGLVQGDEGVRLLRAFLESRWHGLRPVLWDGQLIQEQLQEAIHCGLSGLEL
jgi:glycerol-3-phosphate dehydrogenase